jgi:hypothetical protein
MSAFLSSNDAISALATYWETSCNPRSFTTPATALLAALAETCEEIHGVYDQLRESHEKFGTTDAVGLVFQLLLSENVASLAARYPDFVEETEATAKGYCFRRLRTVQAWANNHELGKLVGIANGYCYQSCEHDGWSKSVAYQIIKQIERNMLKSMEARDCGCDTNWADFSEQIEALVV